MCPVPSSCARCPAHCAILLCQVPCALRRVLCALCRPPAPCALRHVLCALCQVPCSLRPAPCAMRPALCARPPRHPCVPRADSRSFSIRHSRSREVPLLTAAAAPPRALRERSAPDRRCRPFPRSPDRRSRSPTAPGAITESLFNEEGIHTGSGPEVTEPRWRSWDSRYAALTGISNDASISLAAFPFPRNPCVLSHWITAGIARSLCIHSLSLPGREEARSSAGGFIAIADVSTAQRHACHVPSVQRATSTVPGAMYVPCAMCQVPCAVCHRPVPCAVCQVLCAMLCAMRHVPSPCALYQEPCARCHLPVLCAPSCNVL